MLGLEEAVTGVCDRDELELVRLSVLAMPSEEKRGRKAVFSSCASMPSSDVQSWHSDR